MSLKTAYPKTMEKLQNEEIDEIRKLIVVDENYDDIDSDEFDVFDPSEYNYLVYITQRLQDVLGKEKLEKLIERLDESEEFQSFYANEIDMYGVMTAMENEEKIAQTILTKVEEILS